MKRSTATTRSSPLAMAISMGLHAILVLGAYYYCFSKVPEAPASGYRIVLQSAVANSPSEASQPILEEEQEVVPCATEVSQPANEQSALADVPLPTEVPAPEQKLQAPTSLPPAPAAATEDTHTEKVPEAPADEPAPELPVPTPLPAIDERGLYKTENLQQMGAQLELPGWEWDAVPQPQDDSDECGKIVFEIKIDEMGEVVAIKTLEKTVSPLVAEVYREALAQLTFSKTSSSRVYAPISTGKVTFVIQLK